MQDFRQVDVWVKAHRLTLDVYRTTDDLPKSEVFGITVQLQRARAGAFELEYLLLLCRDLGFLPEPVYLKLLADLTTVKKMISGLIRRL